MDRRTFLMLGAATLGLAGCTSGSADSLPPPTGPTPSDPPDADGPDVQLRAQVAASEVALILLYHQALAAMPGRRDLLQEIMDQHAEHLARVDPGVQVPAAGPSPPVPTPTGSSGSGSPAPSGSEGPTPAAPAITLADLAAAESAAQAERVSACDAAADPALARVLCLVGASEAQHAALLERRRRARGST